MFLCTKTRSKKVEKKISRLWMMNKDERSELMNDIFDA
jgi:hypothetical protein